MIKFTHNKVPMTKKRKALFAAVEFYARYLKIHKKDITVNVVFKYLLTDTFSEYGHAVPVGKNRYNLTIDADISLEHGWAILAHEMVHIRQFENGTLSEDDEGFRLWKGNYIPANVPYHKEPWEVEAMKKQTVMMYAYVHNAKE